MPTQPTRSRFDAHAIPAGKGESWTVLLTPAQVADRLQVSVAWVRDHATRKHPRLPVVRIGGLLRFDPGDIDQWIEEQRAAGLRRAC